MIAVTEIAREKLVNYLEENTLTSPIRVTLIQGGCSGAVLGLAIDEAKEDDVVESFDTLTFLMNRKLLEQCGSFSIDFVESGEKAGFTIGSSNPLPGVGSGCSSSSCKSGGCGC